MTRRHSTTRRVLIIGLAVAVIAGACSSGGDSGTGGLDTTDGELSSLSGGITGSGASFPDAAYQSAIAEFTGVAPDLNVTYNAIGSGSGKEEFANDLNDWAGTDSLVDEGDRPDPGTFFYIPTTASPVTVAYNLSDVEELRLDGPTLAAIFMRDITTWDDREIADLNPDVDLPDTEITVAHRSDGSGTTANFTAYLDSASDGVWTLGANEVVEWPADTVGGAQNTGVAQIVQQSDGAIGYVDLADAMILGLQMASIRNLDGNFIAPSVKGATAAVAGSTRSPELTYDPLNAPGADAYPITAPTYVLVRSLYDSQELVENVTGWVRWLITEGIPSVGPELGYAPLPQSFIDAALTQLDLVSAG